MVKQPASTSAETAKVWEMMKKIDICMLVTQDEKILRGRPMSTIPKPDQGVIYLLTEAETSAASDIAKDPSVFLSYQGGSDHVALTGSATVEDNPALVKELWSPGAQAFWPDGPETPGIVVLCIRALSAEYWDGPNPVVGAAKFLYSLARGEQPDLGDSGQVNLG